MNRNGIMRSTLPSTGSTYYCHGCADHLGLLNDLHTKSTNPSSYQIDKAGKHVKPSSIFAGISSVLNSGSTDEYEQLSCKALQEGFVELETSGARSLVYQSTDYLGRQFNNGVPGLLLDAFRWVLSSASSQAHGYPDNSTRYNGIKCSYCGRNLIEKQT